MKSKINTVFAVLLAMRTLAVCAAGEVNGLNIEDDRLGMGDISVPVFGCTNYLPRTTIFPSSAAGWSPAAYEMAAKAEKRALEAWTVGRIFCEQPSNYRIGDYCTMIPTNGVDWAATRRALLASDSYKAGNVIFVDSATNDTERILFTGSGTVPVPWVDVNGHTNMVYYKIDKSVNERPYRLYATRVDEGNTAAYVDLRGKYVEFFGESNLLSRTYSPETMAMTSNIVEGIDYNASSGMLTARYQVDKSGIVRGRQGQFVLAYYDTETKDRMVARIVVEIVLPMVNTLTASVGQELRPLGGGYEIGDLSVSVRAGLDSSSDDPYAPYIELYQQEQSTAAGEMKGRNKVFAIAPTDKITSGTAGMDMPWKIDLYWRSSDPMGTQWTFENDWYLVTWPTDTPTVVTSGDSERPGYPLCIPTNYTVQVMNYRYPVYLQANYDSMSGRLCVDGEGQLLVKLLAGGTMRPMFLPLAFKTHQNADVCAPNPLVWPVGREIEMLGGSEYAGKAADRVRQMDAAVPGYIHEPSSKGYNWNPRLYHFSMGASMNDLAAEMPAMTDDGPTEADPYAKLVSSIYGVNESSNPIEVWWSGVYRGTKERGGTLPYPITYPGFVQQYVVSWTMAQIDGLYPTIGLFSQKGSADPTLRAAAGLALRFVNDGSSATVSDKPFFVYGRRMSFSFRFRSSQDGVNSNEFATVGRLATVRSTANSGRVLSVSVVGVDDTGVELVSSVSGRTTVTNHYAHQVWHDIMLEIPRDLSGSELTFSFGRENDDAVEGAPQNIEIDRLACWSGDATGPDQAEDVSFLFTLNSEDVSASGDLVASTIGGCSLNCHGCEYTLGSPEQFDGYFQAENGIEPTIYYENDPTACGYNPNEEHAFVTSEDDGFVAWAMRSDLNDRQIGSLPMVLVQYAQNGKGRMQPLWVETLADTSKTAYDAPLDGAGSGVEANSLVFDAGVVENDETEGENKDGGPIAPRVLKVVVGNMMPPPAPIGKIPGCKTLKDFATYVSISSDSQNAVYKDRKNQMWARCAGEVTASYWYPLLEGFYVPSGSGLMPGDLVGWMNSVGNATPTKNQLVDNLPTTWRWKCEWPDTNSVPTMSIGQALTFAQGRLPEMWNAASMAVAYPVKGIDATTVGGVVELIDPMVAQTAKLPIRDNFATQYGFTVGARGTCQLRKGKYYFTGCPPSVSDRFYVDTNADESKRMVLVGDYVEKEAGGSYLRLNVLSDAERSALKALCTKGEKDGDKKSWDAAIDELATKAVHPVVQDGIASPDTIELRYKLVLTDKSIVDKLKNVLADGYKVTPNVKTGKQRSTTIATHSIVSVQTNVTLSTDSIAYKQSEAVFKRFVSTLPLADRKGFVWNPTTENKSAKNLVVVEGSFKWNVNNKRPKLTYNAKDHLALIASGDGDGWVTLVENDDPDTSHVSEGLPVQMHVIRVEPKLYADGIAVIPDAYNKLSEKLTLLYRTPLGDSANNFKFEWRRTRPDADGTVNTNRADWASYDTGVGHVSQLLGDHGATVDDYVNNYYSLRYCPVEGTRAYETIKAAIVSKYGKFIEDKMWSDWSPYQLAEGWLQRVLNSVTPFAQRVEDFRNQSADIGYTMMEQIGRPYDGDVALNNDNLANIGLLELYQTVFNRCESMMTSFGSDRDLSKQLLQAATRISEFYSLLGMEAYSDAKNPLIQAADGQQYPAGTFSFANQAQSLLDEELALLRGRASLPALPSVREAPCFNRLAWNLTRGQTEGEVAYVNNYGIRARDGILDVNCAAAQYPQGHGDAWGHYLSALKTYYRLLRNPNFVWTASMMEMLMDQKITNVDYQDEQKFADIAVKLAQTGLDAMDLTIRKTYRDNGADVAAGFFDSDRDQAFGYGEWATRTGMGAIYNWMVGNALLPTNNAPYAEFTDRGIMKIDRTTATQLRALCNAVKGIEQKLGDVESGLNPLGLDENAIPFDIDPDRLAAKSTHFEQILERAEKALANCKTVLDYANVYGARLRQIQTDESAALDERKKVEQSYRNQLVAIYGTPFPGDIGPGGTYPQGYEGPDLYNYNCMDLDQFGLTNHFSTVFTNTLTVYKFKNNGTDGQVYVDTKETIKLKYTVTSGGIRGKEKWMTGVRATEGTLQEKYRAYLIAYGDQASAMMSYQSAVVDMNRIALNVQTGVARASIQKVLKGLEIVTDWVRQFNDDNVEKHRWSMLESNLNGIGNALNSSSGEFTAGLASGKDLEKQIKLGLSGVKFEINAANQFAETTITDATKYASDTVAYFLAQVDAVWNLGWDWYETIRDLGYSLRVAIVKVKLAAIDAQTATAKLANAEAAYRAELYKGEMLQEDLMLWRQQLANTATASRYADMYNRMQRNLALTKYTAAFDAAQRYVWELAKVYDYETGLLSEDPQSGRQFLADIIATRSLGQEGVAISSGTTDGGLYDIVSRLKDNFDVLKPRLGMNNPDIPEKWFSLRHDLFRCPSGQNGDNAAWSDVIGNCWVENIYENRDFQRFCQPLAKRTTDAAEPGFIITFSTSIYGGENFFGQTLSPGDGQFSASDYATKIAAVGVYFENYDRYVGSGGDCVFAAEPNIYLVPIGQDVMRSPVGVDDRRELCWNVVDQVLPLPCQIGSDELDNPAWFTTFSGLSGVVGEAATIRRHSTLRMGYRFTSTRLVGRSAWNTKWMLVIPASTINALKDADVKKDFISHVTDIKLGIRAYSRSGN